MTEPGTFATASAARGMLFTAGGFALSVVGGLFTAAYTFRQIGPNQYGAYVLLLSVLGLAAVLQAGLFQAVVRAATGETNAGRHEVESAYLLNSLLAVLFLVIGGVLALILPRVVYLAPSQVFEFRVAAILLGASSALTCWTASFSGLVVSRNRFEIPFLGQACALIARVGLLVLLVPRWGVAAIGVATLAGSVLERAIVGSWVRRNEPWFSLVPSRGAASGLRRVTSFTWPLLLFSATGSLMMFTDYWVLNAVTTTAAVGLYRVGSVLPQYVSGFLQALLGVLFPRLTKESDADQRELITARTSRPLCLCAGLFLGAALVAAPEILELVFGTRNATAVWTFRLFTVALMLDFAVHPLMTLLMSRGRLSLLAKYALPELALNVVLTISLIGWLGPPGAALAALITIVVSDFVVFPLVADRLQSPGLSFVGVTALVPMAIGACVAAACATASASLTNPGSSIVVTILSAGAAGLLVALGVPPIRRDISFLLGRAEL